MHKAYLGPEAVLDRGPRHDRADARRADPARRPRTARARSSSAWPTAAGSTCSPTTSAAPTRRSSPSSRAPRRSRRSRRSRRAAPATSSTTTAPRAPTSCPTASRSSSTSSRNPSHLEYVAPGRRRRHPRRADRRARARTPTATPNAAVPIVLHGDAAFPGQGVVAETLNLQALDGYKVGGTLHLIQNNQVGFTTDPEDARSTRWASDLAKGFDVADHPRQRRRRGRLHLRRAPRVRLPPGVRPRRRHRPDRLPPLRPQRGRRARVHAARDVRDDQEQEARRRALRRAARRARASSRRRRSRRQQPGGLGRADARCTRSSRRRSRPPRTPARSSSTTGEYQLDRSPSPEVETAVAGRPAARAQRGAAARARGLHRPPEARQAARAPARGARRRGRHRLGARRGARVRLAAHRGHAGPPHRPGRRARHVLPAPPRPARREDRPDALARSRTCPARWRRSSCTTRR